MAEKRGDRFNVLPPLIGRTAFPFVREFFSRVPFVSRRYGDDMLQFAALENANVVSGNKNITSAAGIIKRQTLTKQLSGGSRERFASKFFPSKSGGRIIQSCKVVFTDAAS